MYAIAGAILINAACILMATERDTFDIYACQRLFMMIGSALLVSDIYLRARAAIKSAKTAHTDQSSSTLN